MSGRATTAVLPTSLSTRVSLIAPILSRSWRYFQNCVCFLAGTSYSSHTTAYVFSATAAGMDGFFFMARATARSASFRLTSSERSLESDTALYIMALAALTCSTVTSPSTSSSAMFAERSRSSIAILASPYSEACSAIRSRASSDILPG